MTQRYDIIATLPAGTTTAQIPEMLKSLLEDRFGLKSHKSQKEFSVYTLERGKRPFTLAEVQPTDDPEGIVVLPTQSGNGVAMRLGRGASFSLSDAKFDGKGMSMEMLASISSQFLTVPAVNRTDLMGFYNLHVDLNPEDFSNMMMTAAAKRGVSVPPQLLEQLEASKPGSFFSGLDKVGLKMEKGKAFLNVITIDEAKQTPTEN